jgi:hypothetical protein
MSRQNGISRLPSVWVDIIAGTIRRWNTTLTARKLN